MILSFGLQEGRNQRSSERNTAELKMDFLIYGVEILLVQLNAWLIKLALSSRGIGLVLFTWTFQLTFLSLTEGQQHAFGKHKIFFWRTLIFKSVSCS